MSLPQNGNRDKTLFANQDMFPPKLSGCALVTGQGPSAVAVIAVTASLKTIEPCFTPRSNHPMRAGQVRFGCWRGENRDLGEDIVVTPLAEDRFEIHCHGGNAAAQRILEDLNRLGIPINREVGYPQAVTTRIIAEAIDQLANCQTNRIAAIVMNAVRGVTVCWADEWNERFANDARIPEEFIQQVEDCLARGQLSTRITESLSVVLVGPPNVGKSSLINALVGFDRSIIFDEAGTTRDVIQTSTVVDGIPVCLSDTAGIHESDDFIESEGVARAKRMIEVADLVVAVRQNDQSHVDLHDANRVIHVLNKIDVSTDSLQAHEIGTSATTGEGIESLLKSIGDALGKLIPDADKPLPLNQRQLRCFERLKTTDNTADAQNILNELVHGDDGRREN